MMLTISKNAIGSKVYHTLRPLLSSITLTTSKVKPAIN